MEKDWFDWMQGYDHEREHDARFVQYLRLEEWAQDHDVEFEVSHYDDCHILSATHHLPDGKCSWAYVKFPHKGGMHDLRPLYDDTLHEFVGLFSKYGHPMQPTFPIGAVA